MTYEPTIGLEIHAELKTRTKMFCDSLNDPDETRPNINICPICLGHPGTLPVINREALRHVVRVGLALHGEITPSTHFERKNYFYPDLPKGYQISQYQQPLVRGGYLDIPATPLSEDPETANHKSQITGKSQSQNSKSQTRRIRIRRIHLEEDTGRSIHDPETKTTLLDFNRAGIPLMELVTEPDLSDAHEARAVAEELQRIFRYVGASDANMEKGEMRIEANVSVRPAGSTDLGTKVELKNINSFRFVEDAIRFEIERQTGLLERGEPVGQETRGWDAQKGVTIPQRLKEESHDYRYFPEPDLPPLQITPETIAELRRSLPELPAEKLRRFLEEYRIDPKLAGTLIRDRELAAFFEAAASELKSWLRETGGDPNDPKPLQLAANYLTTDVASLLAKAGIPIQASRLTPENFAELVTYLVGKKISSRTAKEVLAEMVARGADPSVIIEERHLWQVGEAGALASAVEHAIAANPKAAADYRSGKAAALQFLIGQVMKEAAGANPEAVRKLLEEKLKS